MKIEQTVHEYKLNMGFLPIVKFQIIDYIVDMNKTKPELNYVLPTIGFTGCVT
jgi:hypothetical protein